LATNFRTDALYTRKTWTHASSVWRSLPATHADNVDSWLGCHLLSHDLVHAENMDTCKQRMAQSSCYTCG